MPRKLLCSVTALVLAALVLAACGVVGRNDGTTRAGSDEAAITVTLFDTMRFEPDALTVNAGQEVTIELVNEGSIPHNFSIDEVAVEQDLDAGESQTLRFTAPEQPGEYRIYCDEPGHEVAGMVGTLVVIR